MLMALGKQEFSSRTETALAGRAQERAGRFTALPRWRAPDLHPGVKKALSGLNHLIYPGRW